MTGKSKKKYLRPVGLILSLVFLLILNGLFGNPLSKYLASKSIEDHISRNYSGYKEEGKGITYDFKRGGYFSSYRKPGSLDRKFRVHSDMLGRIVDDTYESQVLSGFNSYSRLSADLERELGALLEEGLESEDIARVLADYGEEDFRKIDESFIDREYDLRALGLRPSVTVYFRDKDLSLERLGDKLLLVDDFLTWKAIDARDYSIGLELIGADGQASDSLAIYNFPRERLREGDLLGAMEEHMRQGEKKGGV